MSYLKFVKMNGAGNDFIVIEQTPSLRELKADEIRLLCDRKRGIGADGLILLENCRQPGEKNLVRMDFYNCDGSRASLCGNGLRCAASFAYEHHLAEDALIQFITGAGVLRTRVLDKNLVRIELPVAPGGFVKHENVGGYTVWFGRTGVPHAVVFVPNLDTLNITGSGSLIRNHPMFQPDGTNVDFLPSQYDLKQPVRIRAFERGVEGETLACGTGTGAAACVLHQLNPQVNQFRFLTASGDVLTVEFPNGWESMEKLYLTGPAVESFHGSTDIIKLEI